jgi:hypothetical protein
MKDNQQTPTHAYAKGAAQEFPVTVKVPVSTAGTTAERVQPLLDTDRAFLDLVDAAAKAAGIVRHK